MAGASVRSDDAGFFLYNPATLSNLEGSQSYMDLRGFAPVARISASHAVSPAGIDVTGDGASGDITDVALAPGSVTALRLSRDLTLGLGGSASFATDVESEEQWAGRYHLMQSRMVSMGMTAALSYELTPAIAVSAGVIGDYFDTRFENIAILPGPGGRPVETVAFMKGTDWGLGGVAGIVIKPLEGTRIGVSYHSKIAHAIDGSVGVHAPGVPSDRPHYDIDLPQYVTAGIEQYVTPQLRLFGEVQWIDWSTFTGFNISFASGRPNEVRPVEWQDSWLFAAGFAYALTPATEVSAGVHYDMAASSGGSGQTLSPDPDKIMAAIGISQVVENIGTLTLSYAHVFGRDAPVDADNRASGALEGTLSAHVDMVGIGLKRMW